MQQFYAWIEITYSLCCLTNLCKNLCRHIRTNIYNWLQWANETNISGYLVFFITFTFRLLRAVGRNFFYRKIVRQLWIETRNWYLFRENFSSSQQSNNEQSLLERLWFNFKDENLIKIMYNIGIFSFEKNLKSPQNKCFYTRRILNNTLCYQLIRRCIYLSQVWC